MARKRRGFFKRRAQGFRSFKKSVRKSGSSANLMTAAAAAAVYGAVRPKIEQVIAPYTSKIPLVGSYTDEVALGLAGYMLAKGKMPFLKGKMAKSAGTAIMLIEAARIGSGVSAGMLPTSDSSSENNFESGW